MHFTEVYICKSHTCMYILCLCTGEHVPKCADGAEVYLQLRILLNQADKGQFQQLLTQFLSYLLSHNLNRFHAYFTTYYCSRIAVWAPCYHERSIVNTNMHLENFHRLLKTVYMEGKHNRRINQLLSILLRVTRDKAYERLIKVEKGKVTHRISDINRRHQRAQEMLLHGIEVRKVAECTWLVQSSQLDDMHTVKKLTEDCDCKLTCGHCKACVHMYACTCMDSLIHATVCKHCHIAHMENIREESGLFQCDMESFLEQVAEDGDEQHEQEEEPDKRQDEVDDQLEEGDRELEDADVQLEEGDRELEEGDRELEEGDRELGEGDRELEDTDKQPEEGDKQQAQLNSTSYFSAILTGRENNHLQGLRKQFLQELQAVEMQVRTAVTPEALSAGLRHVRSALHVMRAVDANGHDTSTSSLNPRRQIAPNTRMEHQAQFYSTRKRRATAATTVHKPSSEEAVTTKQKMARVEVTVCGICLAEDNSQSDDIEWIACCKCSLWVHLYCASPSSLHDKENYYCDYCL